MESIYRLLVSTKFRTKNLENFYNMLGDEDSKNKIYMAFGKSSPWAANENLPGFLPPFPDDSNSGLVDAWNNIIGLSKVKKEHIEAVIPRRDWGDIEYDAPYSFFIGDIICVNTNTTNQTVDGKGYFVYKCVDVPSNGVCSILGINNKIDCYSSGGKWTSETISYYPPQGEGDAIDMGDGYKWEYLYHIPLDVVVNSVSNEYIIVPFDDEVRQNPEKWGYTNVLNWTSEISLLYRTKCFQLRYKSFFDSVYFMSTDLLINKLFRQVTMILNPIERKNNPNDTTVYAIKELYQKDELEPHSGEIIYIENRQPIIDTIDQTKVIQIVFTF